MTQRLSLTQQITELRPTDGNLMQRNVYGKDRQIPSLQMIMDIPAANAGVYELREKEVKTLRSRIYSLNRNNAFGWRWRTLLEKGRSSRYQTLLVWRIH